MENFQHTSHFKCSTFHSLFLSLSSYIIGSLLVRFEWAWIKKKTDRNSATVC